MKKSFSMHFLKFTTDRSLKIMYKTVKKLQHAFLDFNQPLGLHMNPNNRWIKMTDSIPWDVFEKSTPHCLKVKQGMWLSHSAWHWVH